MVVGIPIASLLGLIYRHFGSERGWCSVIGDVEAIEGEKDFVSIRGFRWDRWAGEFDGDEL